MDYLKATRSPEGVKAQHNCDSKQVTTNNPKICHKKVKGKERKNAKILRNFFNYVLIVQRMPL